MISKYIWASPPPGGPYQEWLCAIPKEMIPFAAGLLLARQLGYTWEGDPAHVGHDLTNFFIIRLYKGIPMDELLDRLDKTYRLIDSTLNGTTYEATGQPDGSTLILPAIPVVPALKSEQPMRAALDKTYKNAAFELSNITFPGETGLTDTSNTIKTKLLELLAEIDQTEEQNTEIIAKLVSVIAAL